MNRSLVLGFLAMEVRLVILGHQPLNIDDGNYNISHLKKLALPI